MPYASERLLQQVSTRVEIVTPERGSESISIINLSVRGNISNPDKAMEWTRDKTLALISEYRKRRGLWDMTHEDYRKKEVKKKLLLEVSSCLGNGISLGEVEKKFHTLRTQYHREINRMKRKEPYNSKWFGFKYLQFLSSPMACRTNKGRIKSEITEEGTVTKYIIREATVHHDTSGGSINSSANDNEDFYTLHRKPTIVYEAVNASETNGGGTGSERNSIVTPVNSRTHELEKLIEETTEDVDEIEEPKSKIAIKEISVPIAHQHTYDAQMNSTEVSEISTGEAQEVLHQQHEHSHSHHQQQEDPHTHNQALDDEDEHVETLDIHGGEDDGTVYQTTTATAVPARIIKVRREPCQEETYYDDQQHEGTHHNYTVSTSSSNSVSASTKRIYYEQSGATILTPMNTPIVTSTIVGTSPKIHHTMNRTNIQPSQPQQQSSQMQSPLQARDEFSTYGEYVANEIRSITNREILISLKHKINTALFEASMAELQK